MRLPVNPPTIEPQLLTVNQFKELAGVGHNSAYRILNSGAVKAVKGTRTMIVRESAISWINSLPDYSDNKAQWRGLGRKKQVAPEATEKVGAE